MRPAPSRPAPAGRGPRRRYRRGDLDELLPPPLQAAVPVAEHRHRAGAVAQQLDLDVPGPGQQLLGVHPPVTEGRRRLGGAPAHRLGHVVLPGHRPQPAPAAARHRLDHHRAVLAQQVAHLLRRRVDAGPGQHRHAQLARPGPGRGLVAEQRERLRIRPGEAQPGRGAPRGQLGPLGQEAVAGVQGVAARPGGRGQDRVDVEVGGHPGAGQLDRGVGPGDVPAGGVVSGVDRHRLDAEHRRRRHDADRDLAAVGDQQPLDHAPSCGQRIVGGDDKGVDAGIAVQRRGSLLAQDRGGTAVGGQRLGQERGHPRAPQAAGQKSTVTVWSITNGSMPDSSRKCQPIGIHSSSSPHEGPCLEAWHCRTRPAAVRPGRLEQPAQVRGLLAFPPVGVLQAAQVGWIGLGRDIELALVGPQGPAQVSAVPIIARISGWAR